MYKWDDSQILVLHCHIWHVDRSSVAKVNLQISFFETRIYNVYVYYLGMTIALRFIVSQTKVNVKIVLWNQHNQIQSNSSDERGWGCKNTRNSFAKSYHISYSKLEGKEAVKEMLETLLIWFYIQCNVMKSTKLMIFKRSERGKQKIVDGDAHKSVLCMN